MDNTQRQAIDNATSEMIEERAKRAAFNMPLPQSVNELAGMLAGFAMGVRKDITDECIAGYLAVRAEKPVKDSPIKLTVLENRHCRIELRDGSISGRDKTDMANEPAMFTKNKRGIDKQWVGLMQVWSDETTFRGAINALRVLGAKVHDYCAMD